MSGSFQFQISSSKAEMISKENSSGEEFIHETKTTLIVDEIEIKHEEMDYNLHQYSTPDDPSENHPNLDLETMSNIIPVECGSTKANEKDLKDFYLDLLLCDRECETCVKYMRMLKEHVRTTHAPPQPIQDPLLIDSVPIPLTDQSSSSIQIKSEVEEDIVEMGCSVSEELPAQSSESDPDYNVESDSESDPEYAPSPSLTKKIRCKGQSLAKTVASSQSRSTKSKKRPREHFKCEQCSKSYKHLSRFKEHMRVHTREKPFKCNLCDTSFARSDYLIEHKRMHTGEKPFKCETCPKSFTRQSSLTKHKRIHTGERPYKCDVCEMRFTGSTHLIRHKTIHTLKKPFKCTVCEKGFELSTQLTRHMISHTKDNP